MKRILVLLICLVVVCGMWHPYLSEGSQEMKQVAVLKGPIAGEESAQDAGDTQASPGPAWHPTTAQETLTGIDTESEKAKELKFSQSQMTDVLREDAERLNAKQKQRTIDPDTLKKWKELQKEQESRPKKKWGEGLEKKKDSDSRRRSNR